VKNRYLLLKCIALGALTFPTPFLVLFYIYNIAPEPDIFFGRFFVVIFLILSGSMIGVVFYYRDSAMETIKDWFPSEPNSQERGKKF
jgi:hypothetical protein